MEKNYSLKRTIALFFLLSISNFLNAQTLIDENFIGTSLPVGWTISSTAAGNETWAFYDAYDDMEVEESYAIAQDERAITPSMDLSTFSNIYLSFSPWMFGVNSAIIADKTDYTVEISTNNGASWTQIWSEDELTQSDFDGEFFYDRVISKSLASFCGPGMNNVKISFHFTSTGNATAYSAGYLMGVKVSTDCPKTSMGILNATTLNWFPINGYSGTYDIEYGPYNFIQGTGTMVTGLTGSTYTLPSSLCKYSTYIRTNCGAQQGTWNHNYFTNVTYNITNLPTSNTNVITWTDTASNHDIEYGLAGFAQGTGTTVSNIPGNTYSINGLTPNTNYKYFIRSNCDPGLTWSNSTFSTTTLSLNNSELAENLSIYPNPTSDIVNIETNQLQLYQIELYDIQGRLLMSKEMKTDEHSLTISHLEKATYFIKLYTDKGIKNMKIIKQ